MHGRPGAFRSARRPSARESSCPSPWSIRFGSSPRPAWRASSMPDNPRPWAGGSRRRPDFEPDAIVLDDQHDPGRRRRSQDHVGMLRARECLATLVSASCAMRVVERRLGLGREAAVGEPPRWWSSAEMRARFDQFWMWVASAAGRAEIGRSAGRPELPDQMIDIPIELLGHDLQRVQRPAQIGSTAARFLQRHDPVAERGSTARRTDRASRVRCGRRFVLPGRNTSRACSSVARTGRRAPARRFRRASDSIQAGELRGPFREPGLRALRAERRSSSSALFALREIEVGGRRSAPPVRPGSRPDRKGRARARAT